MGELRGITRFQVSRGQGRGIQAPVRSVVMEIVRTKEAGTLQYEIYFNNERVRVHRHRAVPGLR